MSEPTEQSVQTSEDDAPRIKEPALNNVISHVLRGGVLLSAAFVICGYLVMVSHGLPTRHWHHFNGRPIVGRLGVLDVLIGLQQRRSAEDFVTLGLLILIMTPVVRVALSWVIFLYENDKLYACITAFVFLVLIASLLGLVS